VSAPKNGGTSGSMTDPKTKHSPRGKCGPYKTKCPKIVPGKKPPGPDVLTKGKPTHCEKIPPREGCANIRKFETS
jgi:hypothetical protein